MTQIGHSTSDTITVRGHDLARDLIGKISISELISLLIRGELPSVQERKMIDALVVSLAEHGLTPSTIAARLTLLGAPESLQGAVAAGLAGAGSVFLGTIEETARMLHGACAGLGEADMMDKARDVVGHFESHRKPIPGLGHPIHSAGDPRVGSLLAVAKETGNFGLHCQLLELIAEEAFRIYDKNLPINGAGVVGAIAVDMGFEPEIVRGLGLIARSIGLVAHLREEMHDPIAKEIWLTVDQGTWPSAEA